MLPIEVTRKVLNSCALSVLSTFCAESGFSVFKRQFVQTPILHNEEICLQLPESFRIHIFVQIDPVVGEILNLNKKANIMNSNEDILK